MNDFEAGINSERERILQIIKSKELTDAWWAGVKVTSKTTTLYAGPLFSKLEQMIREAE